MIMFIDDYRDVYGVEPICRVVPIAPSTYYEYKRQQRDLECRSDRARRDEMLRLRSAGCSMRTTGCMGLARCGAS